MTTPPLFSGFDGLMSLSRREGVDIRPTLLRVLADLYVQTSTHSDEEARQRYSAVSGSAAETEAHAALWRAIREDRLAKVTDNVERILGRKPITLDQWAKENAAAFRG